MDEIREASDADLTLCQVKCLILDGWPKSIKSVPVEARAYWNVRDELHIADGVILFGERVVVPPAAARPNATYHSRKPPRRRKVQCPSQNCSILARYGQRHRASCGKMLCLYEVSKKST